MTAENNDTLLGQGGKESGAPIKGTKSGSSGSKTFEEGTGKTLAVSFTQDGIKELIAALEKVTGNARGGKISIHHGTKTAKTGGRQFTSSFLFVGEIQEPVADGQFTTTQPKMVAMAANVPTEL